nr:hypothetical protein [Tanacetum cinerariifolium]
MRFRDCASWDCGHRHMGVLGRRCGRVLVWCRYTREFPGKEKAILPFGEKNSYWVARPGMGFGIASWAPFLDNGGSGGGYRKFWNDLKKMMLEEFCPEEEISRMEDELRHLRLKGNDIVAYTNRFNELVLLCPDVVPSTKKKIGQYIKGLPSHIKGETYASKPTTLNEAVRMAHGLMEHKIQGWNERNVEQNKRK